MLVKGRPTLEFISLREKSFREMVIDKIIFDGRAEKTLTAQDKDKYIESARAYFDSHTILQNRETARILGIESATIASKSVLTDKLVDFVWGLQYFSQDKPALEVPSDKRFTLSDELAEIEKSVKGEFVSGDIVSGYIELLDSGHAIARVSLVEYTPEDIMIIRRMVNVFNLRDGDEVECRVHYNPTAKCLVAHCIDKINGKTPGDDKVAVRKVKPTDRVILSADEWGINNTLNLVSPLYRGQSALISYTGRMEEMYAFNSIVSGIENSNAFDEVYGISATELMNNDARALSRITAYAVTASKSEKKIAIVIADLDYAVKNDIDLAVKILSSACAYSSGGSVTVISFIDTENPLYKSVKRLPNTELKLRFYPYNHTYTVDMENSYSFGAVGLLNGENIARNRLYSSTADERIKLFACIKQQPDYTKLVKTLAGEL